MATHLVSSTNLSDDRLLTEVHRLAAAERCTTAALIRLLIELDNRPHLYLRDGCSSLFGYCTQVLHLEEGATYNRIEVARAARRFPTMLDALEDGSVTLTALRLLAPHLTDENHGNVLAAIRHKSKADVERLIASLRPKPDVPAVIRRLPEPRQHAAQPVTAPGLMFENSAPVTASPAPPIAQPSRAAVTPLSTVRYKLELTISAETRGKLHRVQDLLRHAVPTGDLAEIVDRALTSLLQHLEQRRFAATSAPRAARKAASESRYIPAPVRRAVWRRNDGRCAFVGERGRCTETAFLEFHHLKPYAVGGGPTVDNIELRCRAHNRYEAQLFFGDDLPQFVRESQLEWPISHELRTRFGPTASATCSGTSSQNRKIA